MTDVAEQLPAYTDKDRVARLRPLAGLGLAARFWWDPVGCMDDYHRRLGPAVVLQRAGQFPNKYLFLVGADYNQRVLTRTDIVRPRGLWFLDGEPGSALSDFHNDYLKLSGKEHAAASGKIAPHLRKSRTKEHFEQVKAIAIEGIGRWPVGTRIDLYSKVKEVAQRAAFSALFGEPDVERAHDFGERLAAFHQTSWSSLAHFLHFDLPGLPYARARRQAESLKSFIVAWVKERRGVPRNQDLRAAVANMRDAWTGRLIGDGKIAGYTIFLAFASYETMSSALTWILLRLARHSDIAADLADELHEVQPIETLDRDRLLSLPLLDAVVKEGLRLDPPTPYIPLRTLASWEIDGCDLVSGAHIILNPRLTHRNKELYPEPERFMPERWSKIRPSAYAYLPFSGGPRRCPGEIFALDFLKIALAVSLTRYRFGIARGGRVAADFAGIMMPKSNIPVVLSPV